MCIYFFKFISVLIEKRRGRALPVVNLPVWKYGVERLSYLTFVYKSSGNAEGPVTSSLSASKRILASTLSGGLFFPETVSHYTGFDTKGKVC